MSNYTLKKLNTIIVTLVFSIAILSPLLVGIIEEDKDILLIEKRKRTPFPRIGCNINDIEKFPKLFDLYYSDHFGFRDWLTKYYKIFKFNIGDSPSPDVTIGKEGWLFLGSVKKGYCKHSDPFGDVINANLYSDDELKKFAEYMVSLKAWLNAKGIEYVFVITPNKHTVYCDKLPDYISKVNPQSSTDQLVEYLKANTTVPVVDLRKILIENKKQHQLYYKTDTHWNHYAANIAQYEIMLEIEKLFPNLINPENYKMRDGVRGGGDLAGFIGMGGFHEVNPQPIFDKSCEPIKSPVNAKGRETHSFICEEQKLSALIFRDSFFIALQPYFARKFKKSTYIWQKLNYSALKRHLDFQDYDIVIEQWVERSLPFMPPFVLEFNPQLYRKMFECSNKSIFSNDFRQLKCNSQSKKVSYRNIIPKKNPIWNLKQGVSTNNGILCMQPVIATKPSVTSLLLQKLKPNTEYIVAFTIFADKVTEKGIFVWDLYGSKYDSPRQELVLDHHKILTKETIFSKIINTESVPENVLFRFINHTDATIKIDKIIFAEVNNDIKK